MRARKEPSGGAGRKREHTAFLLPVAAALLIVPPLLTLFGARLLLFGVPLQTAYLFVAWLAMVAGAALLARWLPDSDVDEQAERPRHGNGEA